MRAEMFRYQLAVNDEPQLFDLRGDPRHVEAGRVTADIDADSIVDFWVEHRPDKAKVTRAFQIFGTGHPLPKGARYWGTTGRTPGGSVWHLFEVPIGEAL